jgi:thioredoxin-related protein
MNVTKLKHHLEIATNMAVVLVAVVVLTMFAREFFKRLEKPEIQPGLQRGLKLDKLPEGVTRHSNLTLIMVMSTTCHYCNESVSFYNQLAEMHSKANTSVALVAVFPNSTDQVKSYAEQQHLKLPTVAAMDFRSLNVTATPTLILIDSDGRVRDFWIGKLSKEEEHQVIEAAGLFGE